MPGGAGPAGYPVETVTRPLTMANQTRKGNTTMGEYAIDPIDKEVKKIGTECMMYYLRWEDRSKVIPVPNSLDPSKEKGLYFRPPYPEEDQDDSTMHYSDAECLLAGIEKDVPADTHPGIMQLTASDGMLINVACYHGKQLPKGSGDVSAFWNGKREHLRLGYIMEKEDGTLAPVVECKYCQKQLLCDWEDLYPYVQDPVMLERLKAYSKVGRR